MTNNNTATTELDRNAAELATAFAACNNERTGEGERKKALLLMLEYGYTAAEAAEALTAMADLRAEHANDGLHRDTVQAYIGTYGKYNSGSTEGLWVDLAGWTDAEEMLVDWQKMHGDEHDPELMVQDWDIDLECPGLTSSSLGECPDKDTLQTLLDLLNAEDYEREICLGYLDATCQGLDDFDSFWHLSKTANEKCVGCLETQCFNAFRNWCVEQFMEKYNIPAELENFLDENYIERDYSWDYKEGGNYVFYIH